jgi:hypothetical protein
MKMVRVYAAVFVVCLCLGLGFVALAPRSTLAGPDPTPCRTVCGRIYVDCGEPCNQQIYPGQSWYGMGYPYQYDENCWGPYYCSPIKWGCHICQA